MDETGKPSHICPQQNNDQTESTYSTAHDIFLVVHNEGNSERLRIVQFDPERGDVYSVGEITHLKWPSVMVSCAGSLFCLGDEECSGFVREFDLVKRTSWTPSQLVEALCWTASTASSHEVIVSGGENKSDETVATCSVYAPATNRWTSLQQLRQARHSHRMCWLPDGRVFAIGGCFIEEHLCSVEMLERAWIPTPREEALAEWHSVAPMKTARQGFGCCVVEGRILVAGGWTSYMNSSSVESFEPPNATNIGQWTSLTDLASRVGWCFLVNSAAGLVLIGWYGKMQLGRRKAKVASSEWTWDPCPRLTSFNRCWGMVSLPSTAAASKR